MLILTIFIFFAVMLLTGTSIEVATEQGWLLDSIPQGSLWQPINFTDLLADPGPGAGLDLYNVVNVFVIEVTGGSADFYLDNIFVSNACPRETGCNATINTKATYTLVWSDEFDGTSLNSDNWSMETGYGDNGWGNDEWQLYTNSSSNVSVAGGNLAINARCANPPSCGKRNGTITSGRINSLNKFAFKYGKVEARIKPPVGDGAWPAFWMLGKNYPSVGWPRSGEDHRFRSGTARR